MAGERHRIPGDQEYWARLGLALVAFARLEWNVLYLSNTMEVGVINQFVPAQGRGPSSGQICNRAFQISEAWNGPLGAEIQEALDLFDAAVARRNRLVHANPATANNGEQWLHCRQIGWITPEWVDEAADEFARSASVVHEVFQRLQDEIDGPYSRRDPQ